MSDQTPFTLLDGEDVTGDFMSDIAASSSVLFFFLDQVVLTIWKMKTITVLAKLFDI